MIKSVEQPVELNMNNKAVDASLQLEHSSDRTFRTWVVVRFDDTVIRIPKAAINKLPFAPADLDDIEDLE